ncbi:MAG: 50S ribosomal protein L35 [Bacteroidota bacterium]
MSKVKSHSGIKKRIKVTGSGKLKRRRTGTQHLLRKKSKKAKLKLSHPTLVAKVDVPRLKKLMNI